MSSMYKLSRVMDCAGQLSGQKLREQLLETLISEGYQFDPNHVVVSVYDPDKECLGFMNPGMPPIKIKDLTPLLVEGINYMAETGTKKEIAFNAVDVLWYVEKTEDKSILKRAFKVIESWLKEKGLEDAELYSSKRQDKPLIVIAPVGYAAFTQSSFYIPQNFSVKDILATLLSKGDFPKTIEEGLALYNDKKKAEKALNKKLPKEADLGRH